MVAGCTDDSTEDDYGDLLEEDEELDYDGWFDDVDTYDGTVDARNQGEIDVAVGSGGGYSFGPSAVLIDVGSEVRWEWTGDGGQHDVVHVDGAFESDSAGNAGHTFKHAFTDPGVFRYVCIPHETMGMKGVIVVEE